MGERYYDLQREEYPKSDDLEVSVYRIESDRIPQLIESLLAMKGRGEITINERAAGLIGNVVAGKLSQERGVEPEDGGGEDKDKGDGFELVVRFFHELGLPDGKVSLSEFKKVIEGQGLSLCEPEDAMNLLVSHGNTLPQGFEVSFVMDPISDDGRRVLRDEAPGGRVFLVHKPQEKEGKLHLDTLRVPRSKVPWFEFNALVFRRKLDA